MSALGVIQILTDSQNVGPPYVLDLGVILIGPENASDSRF